MFVRCSHSSSDILAAAHQNTRRCHSERDCHRSTTTQLWNADMSTSSNHTKSFVHCCQGKHTVASSRTLFSYTYDAGGPSFLSPLCSRLFWYL